VRVMGRRIREPRHRVWVPHPDIRDCARSSLLRRRRPVSWSARQGGLY
jgi:hypothetical protein